MPACETMYLQKAWNPMACHYAHDKNCTAISLRLLLPRLEYIMNDRQNKNKMNLIDRHFLLNKNNMKMKVIAPRRFGFNGWPRNRQKSFRKIYLFLRWMHCARVGRKFIESKQILKWIYRKSERKEQRDETLSLRKDTISESCEDDLSRNQNDTCLVVRRDWRCMNIISINMHSIVLAHKCENVNFLLSSTIGEQDRKRINWFHRWTSVCQPMAIAKLLLTG